METIEQIIAPDIFITIYPINIAATPAPAGPIPPNMSLSPSNTDGIEIDLAPYFPELCCFEVIAVQSEDNNKQDGIFIWNDRKGFTYKPDLSDDYWKRPNDFDIIEYCVRDISSELTAIGNLTIQVIENSAFRAADLVINVYKQMVLDNEPMEIDLKLPNKLDNVELVEIGDYNRKLIQYVSPDQHDPAKLRVLLNPSCNNWHSGEKTQIEYAISATIAPAETKVSKGKIIFQYIDTTFFAKHVDIEVSHPLPEFIDINIIEKNNIFNNIYLRRIEGTAANRGATELIPPAIFRYYFNLTSGFWDNEKAEDHVKFELHNNHFDTDAQAYLHLYLGSSSVPPTPGGDISGSGSGSGGSGPEPEGGY